MDKILLTAICDDIKYTVYDNTCEKYNPNPPKPFLVRHEDVVTGYKPTFADGTYRTIEDAVSRIKYLAGHNNTVEFTFNS